MKIPNPWPSVRKDLIRLADFLFPVSLVLNDLKFILFGMVAGYVIFTVPDQARDNFVNMFEETQPEKIDWMYLITFWFSICFWSIHAWAGARTILYLRNYTQFKSIVTDGKWESFTRRILFLQKHLPRLLSLLPFLIVANAIDTALCFNLFATFYVVTGFVFFIILIYRKQLAGYAQSQSDARFSLQITTPSSWYRRFIWITGIILSVYLVGVIVSIQLSQKLQSMLIVGISINFWMYAFMWLQYFSWKLRTSLLVILLSVFYFFSLFNNNHDVRTLNEITAKSVPDLNDIREHYYRFQQNGPEKDTVYLVATQGGGIRAAYWTSLVLMEIYRQNPMMANKLYAVSGASGGTLGAAVYLANLKHYGVGYLNDSISENLLAFYDHDFLAPLTAAYLVPDLLQKFLPFTVSFADRARYLEKSWEAADHTGLFGSEFTGIFNDNTHGNYLPLLMVNSTWIETGQRTVIAPLKISGSEPFIRESFPLMDNWGGQLRLSTAVGIGARFPLLTPGAVIKLDRCKVLGTFADGGYVENTGIATAIDIKDMIKQLHRNGSDSLKPLVIHLLYIENGDTSGTANPEPLRELYETKTVVSGFYNSWDGQDKTTASKVTSYVREYLDLNKDNNEKVSIAFTRISLPRNTETLLPLGWVLSSAAKDYMEQAASPVVKSAFENSVRNPTR
jgi:hypothetical protein